MKKIVVVGGGAGGLELVTRLSKTLGKRKLAEIILVDRSRTHVWKPLLHEVAAGVINKASDGVDYRMHAAQHHYQFQRKKVHLLPRQRSLQRLLCPYARGQLILPSEEGRAEN